MGRYTILFSQQGITRPIPIGQEDDLETVIGTVELYQELANRSGNPLSLRYRVYDSQAEVYVHRPAVYEQMDNVALDLLQFQLWKSTQLAILINTAPTGPSRDHLLSQFWQLARVINLMFSTKEGKVHA